MTGEYKGLQEVTEGYKGLQEVTRGYKELEEVKRDYKRLQEVTMGSLGWKGFQENWVVTTCYKGYMKKPWITKG